MPPNKRADLIVMNETRTWREREVLMFDDSLEHTVMLDIAPLAHRTLLIIDLWHPDVLPQHRLAHDTPPVEPKGDVQDEFGRWGPPKPKVVDAGDAAYPASAAVRRVVQMEQQARLIFEAEEMGPRSNLEPDGRPAQGWRIWNVEAMRGRMQPAPDGFPGIEELGADATSIQLFERVSEAARRDPSPRAAHPPRARRTLPRAAHHLLTAAYRRRRPLLRSRPAITTRTNTMR